MRFIELSRTSLNLKKTLLVILKNTIDNKQNTTP